MFQKGQSGNPAGKPKGIADGWTQKLKELSTRYGVDALELCHRVMMDEDEQTKWRIKAAEVILKPAQIQIQGEHLLGPANSGITVNLGFITAAEPQLEPSSQVLTIEPIDQPKIEANPRPAPPADECR